MKSFIKSQTFSSGNNEKEQVSEMITICLTSEMLNNQGVTARKLILGKLQDYTYQQPNMLIPLAQNEISFFFPSEFYCRFLTNSESPSSKDFSISCQLTHFPLSNFCGVLILISIINMSISMANTIQIGRVRFRVFFYILKQDFLNFFSVLLSLGFVLVFLSMTKACNSLVS